MSGGANPSSGFIYAIRDEVTLLVKIGKTGQSVDTRLKAHQAHTQHVLTLLAAFQVSQHLALVERYIHGFLAEWHHKYEWFNTTMSPRKLEQLIEQAVFAVAEDQPMPSMRSLSRQPTALGMKLRRLRQEKHLTLQALQGLSGVPFQTLSHVERGYTSSVRIPYLTALAKAFGVTIDYLLGNSESRTCQGEG